MRPRRIHIPNLPDVLTLKNGKKVTTAEMWWKQRRPEIVEDFEREVLGRVPQERPEGDLDRHADRDATGRRSHPVIGKQLDRARGQLGVSRRSTSTSR